MKIKKLDESRIANSDFWMREEEYWLSEVEDLALDVQTEGGISFEGIGDDGLERKIRDSMSVSYLDKWRAVAPLKLYQNPDVFAEVLDGLVGWMDDLEVDTIVASFLGAVPMAVGLCERSIYKRVRGLEDQELGKQERGDQGQDGWLIGGVKDRA